MVASALKILIQREFPVCEGGGESKVLRSRTIEDRNQFRATPVKAWESTAVLQRVSFKFILKFIADPQLPEVGVDAYPTFMRTVKRFIVERKLTDDLVVHLGKKQPKPIVLVIDVRNSDQFPCAILT